MPVARFQMPDGRIGRFEVPEGTTPEQAQAMIQASLGESREQDAARDDPTNEMGRFDLAAAGAGKAVADLGRGLKQRWDESAAALESLVPGGQALSRATGRTAADIRDEGAKEVAESKRLDQALMRSPWAVGGNLAGGIASAAPLAALGPVGAGVAFGAATPTTDGPAEVLQNMALGGVGGYVGDKAVRAVSRAIAPKVSPQVKTLLAEGVTPTPGQIIGGKAARFESKMTSAPLLGDAIAKAQNRAGAELNRAALNRALAPIGRTVPKGVPVGRQGVEYVRNTLGDAYDDLLPKLTTQADAAFTRQIDGVRRMVNTGSLDPKAAKAFNRIIDGDVLGKFRGQNAVTGQTLKDIQSDITQHIQRFGASTDADQRLVGDALKEVRSAFGDLLKRTNPAKAAELKAIDSGWANFKRVQRAAGYVGAEDGVFSPSHLQSAVKAADRSKDHARFSEGKALMQDLSDAAKSVMGPRYPDSGTAGRALNIAALMSGLHQPAIPAALIGASGLYTQPAQKAAAALLTKRPASFGLLGSRVEELAPLGGLLGMNLSQ